jgi:UDP-N-acetylglucosamine--dolichyl-phosphate N-acetylglucosaminephosphotransferase
VINLAEPSRDKRGSRRYEYGAKKMNKVRFALASAAFLSFLFTYLLMPYFIQFFRATGIVGRDIMKRRMPVVADMGGSGVIVGLLTGVFFYIAMAIFLFGEIPELTELLASISTILIITLIGIFDVLTTLMRQHEGLGVFERMKRKGIPGWIYFFIPLPAAVPLAAVNAGVKSMVLPLLGRVELGSIYPLVLIPLAVLCCSNATNFLAGFNGLEAGMGFVLHLSLGIYAMMNGRNAAGLIAFTFAAALLAFLKYNWYPAKVFPGDLNYTIGAVCVCVTVLGNMDRFAIICFTPWIVEAVLKALSKFQAESYGVLQPDGTLKPLKKGIHSLTHAVMITGDFKEYQVSIILIVVEAVVCAVSFVLTL